MAGARGLGDCLCLPGYLCTYTRSAVLRIALNTTLTLDQLQADAALLDAFRNGLLTALGVYGLPGLVAEFGGFAAASS